MTNGWTPTSQITTFTHWNTLEKEVITNLFLSTLVAIGPVARPQLPQLTHNDYVNLAKVIRVEAARNTLDEYCVAASILNRVRSNQFPNTVEKVIYSPGQYEGITRNKNVRPDMSLVRELKSEQGQSYLRRASTYHWQSNRF